MVVVSFSESCWSVFVMLVENLKLVVLLDSMENFFVIGWVSSVGRLVCKWLVVLIGWFVLED